MFRAMFFMTICLMSSFLYSAEFGLNDNQPVPNNSIVLNPGLELFDYESGVIGALHSRTQALRTIRHLGVAAGAECTGPHTIEDSVFNYLVLVVANGQDQPFRLQGIRSLQGVELHLLPDQSSDDFLILSDHVHIGPNGNGNVEIVRIENEDEQSDSSDEGNG